MILKGVYGVNVTPRQVGNTVSRFHANYGATGLDLKTMVNAYGHSVQNLTTPNALQQGIPFVFY